jgi:Uma2 family endonuclease
MQLRLPSTEFINHSPPTVFPSTLVNPELSRLEASVPTSQDGETVWALATLYPPQGGWTETDYLALDTSRLIEFKQGTLEFLSITYSLHQDIVQFLFLALHQDAAATGCGRAYIAPLRARTIAGFIREPDVLLVRPDQIVDRRRPVVGAELVMEVISEGKRNRDRDLVEKRSEYAAAGIREYWIIDPETRCIEVLALTAGGEYGVHGRFGDDDVATSALLPEFAIGVGECLAAGD